MNWLSLVNHLNTPDKFPFCVIYFYCYFDQNPNKKLEQGRGLCWLTIWRHSPPWWERHGRAHGRGTWGWDSLHLSGLRNSEQAWSPQLPPHPLAHSLYPPTFLKILPVLQAVPSISWGPAVQILSLWGTFHMEVITFISKQKKKPRNTQT